MHLNGDFVLGFVPGKALALLRFPVGPVAFRSLQQEVSRCCYFSDSCHPEIQRGSTLCPFSSSRLPGQVRPEVVVSVCLGQGGRGSVKRESSGRWAALKRIGPQEGFALLLLPWGQPRQLVVRSGADGTCLIFQHPFSESIQKVE